LLLFLGVNESTSLQSNQTSLAQAKSEAMPSTYYTGKKNISQVHEYIKYQNQSTIQWAEAVPVSGSDGYQFPWPVFETSILYLWIDEILRAVEITYNITTTIYGIPVYNFTVPSSALAPNPIYYDHIQGLANMSSFYGGTPIFLSKPQFLDCDPSVLNNVEGLSPNRALHDSYISVEPNTGQPFSFRKRLMFSVLVPSGTSWFSGPATINPNIRSGVFYPILWGEEGTELTLHLANEYKHLLDTRISIAWGFYWAGVAEVSFFFLVAFIIFLFWLVMYYESGRHPYTKEGASDGSFYSNK